MHKKILLALLGLAASIGPSFGSAHDEPQRGFGLPRVRTNKRYPEQSSRQAMRQFRRQQGGPGIVLNGRTMKYEPQT